MDLVSLYGVALLCGLTIAVIVVWLAALSAQRRSYDAATVARILGLPVQCTDLAPLADRGEVVIYYGGWSLQQLRYSLAGMKRMCQDQDWYDKKGWKAEPGYYRVLLPVPRSNGRNWSKQVEILMTRGETWQPAPVCVAATALLLLLRETGHDLLHGDGCRCAESLRDELRSQHRACLVVNDGWVDIGYDWDGLRDGGLSIAACKKC